mmetsp:Transcript_26309/g.73864  ORF Transcript_26309/g.73864 Transcript_26309/m.73864 type:complete len:218 (-) Transcript_26309:246-899(-)
MGDYVICCGSDRRRDGVPASGARGSADIWRAQRGGAAAAKSRVPVSRGLRRLCDEPLAAGDSWPAHQPHHALQALGLQQPTARPRALPTGRLHPPAGAPPWRPGLLAHLEAGAAGAAAQGHQDWAAGPHGSVHHVQLDRWAGRALPGVTHRQADESCPHIRQAGMRDVPAGLPNLKPAERSATAIAPSITMHSCPVLQWTSLLMLTLSYQLRIAGPA